VADSPAFERAAEELERLSGRARIEVRGTLRLVLRSVGLEAKTATRLQVKTVVERLLAAELESRGVSDAAELCAKVSASLEDVQESGAGRSAIDIFERIGRAADSRK
jgi:hypothetical protein